MADRRRQRIETRMRVYAIERVGVIVMIALIFVILIAPYL